MNRSADSVSNAFTWPDLPAMASRFALASALVVVGLFGTYLLTGISQDPLQYVHPPLEYTAILLTRTPVLRLAIGLDNLFIVFYGSMFLTMGASLWKRTGSKAILGLSLSLLATSTLLDLFENMHFLTMISDALQGLTISQSHIDVQVWESLLKFHVSYLGLFFLGFSLPNDTWLEKALCFLLRWVQLAIGLLIYLVPPSVAGVLLLGRFMFFLLGSLAIAAVFRQRKFDSGERV
jgi:hypothetical protein